MSATVGPAGRRWRADIQALRGYAVIAVILYHSGLGITPSGYLGVDMFFVVSGFLISGIVMRERVAGRFRLGDFYLRRIRRLLPASYTVLATVTIAAICLLTTTGYARFWPQLAGALTFSTNIALWQQINYFNDSATVEPLLHMWSLAIEEQYYLLLPFALALVPRRLWFAAILAVTIASLAGYCWLYPRSPGAAFYLLPTRAWEIGLGSLAAIVAESGEPRRILRLLRPIAVLVVAALPFLAPPASLACFAAVPACLAVLVVLIAGQPGAAAERRLRPLARAGDASYSLYLVHWPLFAFANALYLSAPLPRALSIALIGGTVLLAVPLYLYIEEPIRRAPIAARRLWLIAIGTSLVIGALGYVGLRIKQTNAAPFDLRGVTGLDLPGCDGDATRFDGRCTQSAEPTILLWGDSFSQAILPALDASTRQPIAQASKGGCAPLLGVSPVDLQGSANWARGCLGFSDSVLRYTARTPSIRVVVLTGRYLRYTEAGTRAITRGPDGRLTVGPPSFAMLVAAQRRTTAALRALGKRVVVIGAPPQGDFDVGECWERRLENLPSLGTAPRCAIVPATAHPYWPWTMRLMHAFSRDAATPVIRLDRALCQGSRCRTEWNGVPLYRDPDHLGAAGSVLVGRQLALGERAWRDAR